MLEALKKAYENREPPFTSTELAEKVNALLEPWGVDAEERSSELAAWFFVANANLRAQIQLG